MGCGLYSTSDRVVYELGRRVHKHHNYGCIIMREALKLLCIEVNASVKP